MKILVNHLTRMHGAHICVAGLDVDTRRHVRPVLQHEAMPADMLARYGGPFEMARIVDLGRPRPIPDRPHVEDYVFVPSWAKVQRTASADEFWNFLHQVVRARLAEIFGQEFEALGNSRFGTRLGRGEASLGCLLPRRPPELYLARSREGKPQIRMRLADGRVHADAGVTDLRLYQADHATPDTALVRGVAKWIRDSDCVLLSVGLTRKFRPTDRHEYRHYLQVNNVHLKEDPTWSLG